jgi:hypothetical protein
LRFDDFARHIGRDHRPKHGLNRFLVDGFSTFPAQVEDAVVARGLIQDELALPESRRPLGLDVARGEVELKTRHRAVL